MRIMMLGRGVKKRWHEDNDVGQEGKKTSRKCLAKEIEIKK
jgi:hypothetical protein